jgi:AcrR family transcriptional regulator
MEDSKVTSIIEAARKRFSHYGLTKTTMNEIAADIGMSKASLYYYFPDSLNRNSRCYDAVSIDKNLSLDIDILIAVHVLSPNGNNCFFSGLNVKPDL